jgi:hypothetical protein
MELYAGCYERFLFRFRVSFGSENRAELSQIASHPAHRNAVKCIASHGSYVATGGADDQIHLFDKFKERDLAFVVNPVEGAVPCLAFLAPHNSRQPTHFLSGASFFVPNLQPEYQHFTVAASRWQSNDVLEIPGTFREVSCENSLIIMVKEEQTSASDTWKASTERLDEAHSSGSLQ